MVHFFQGHKGVKIRFAGLASTTTYHLSISVYIAIYLSRVVGFFLEIIRLMVQASIWNLPSICLSSYLSTYLSVYIAIYLSRVVGFYLEVRRLMGQASIWNLPSTVIYRYQIIPNMINTYYSRGFDSFFTMEGFGEIKIKILIDNYFL